MQHRGGIPGQMDQNGNSQMQQQGVAMQNFQQISGNIANPQLQLQQQFLQMQQNQKNQMQMQGYNQMQGFQQMNQPQFNPLPMQFPQQLQNPSHRQKYSQGHQNRRQKNSAAKHAAPMPQSTQINLNPMNAQQMQMNQMNAQQMQMNPMSQQMQMNSMPPQMPMNPMSQQMQMNHMNTPQMGQMNHMNTPQMNQMNTQQMNQMNTPQMNHMNVQQMSHMNTPQMNQMGAQQMNQMNAPQMNHMNPPQMGQMNQMNTPQMNQMGAQQMNQMNAPQMNQMNAPQMNQMNAPQMNQMGGQQMNHMNTQQMNQMSAQQMSHMNTPQMNQMNTPQMNQMNTPQMNQMNTPQMNAQQMSHVNTPQMNQISTPQMSHMNTPQMNQQQVNQMSHINTPQMNPMNPPQMGQMNAQQNGQQIPSIGFQIQPKAIHGRKNMPRTHSTPVPHNMIPNIPMMPPIPTVPGMPQQNMPPMGFQAANSQHGQGIPNAPGMPPIMNQPINVPTIPQTLPQQMNPIAPEAHYIHQLVKNLDKERADLFFRLFGCKKQKRSEEIPELFMTSVFPALRSATPNIGMIICKLIEGLKVSQETYLKLLEPPLPIIFTRHKQNKPLYSLVQAVPKTGAELTPANKDRKGELLAIGTFISLMDPYPQGASVIIDKMEVKPQSFGTSDQSFYLAAPIGKIPSRFNIHYTVQPPSFLTWFTIQFVECKKPKEILQKLLSAKNMTYTSDNVIARTPKCNGCSFNACQAIEEILNNGSAHCPTCHENIILNELEFDLPQQSTDHVHASEDEAALTLAKLALADQVCALSPAAVEERSWSDMIFGGTCQQPSEYHPLVYNDTQEYVSTILSMD